MKQLIITLLIAIVALTAQAQTQPPVQKPAKPVWILLPDSSNLVELQQVLLFSYQWLPKSDAPSRDVAQLVPLIQQLYPMLVAVKKDGEVKVKPIPAKTK